MFGVPPRWQPGKAAGAITMSKTAVETHIIPYLFYRDVQLRHPTASGGMHAQITFGGQGIMMGQGSRDWRMQSASASGFATMGVFIYVADIDAHYERARAAGAVIVHPPHDEEYGRTYTAHDLDGHPWFFTTPLG
jgi:PhnB protein